MCIRDRGDIVDVTFLKTQKHLTSMQLAQTAWQDVYKRQSQIRDTDMATEMVKYSNNNILSQAGQAMLAQSNQANQGVLSLLQ